MTRFPINMDSLYRVFFLSSHWAWQSESARTSRESRVSQYSDKGNSLYTPHPQ